MFLKKWACTALKKYSRALKRVCFFHRFESTINLIISPSHGTYVYVIKDKFNVSRRTKTGFSMRKSVVLRNRKLRNGAASAEVGEAAAIRVHSSGSAFLCVSASFLVGEQDGCSRSRYGNVKETKKEPPLFVFSS